VWYAGLLALALLATFFASTASALTDEDWNSCARPGGSR
jgi:hypothetical protein